jgi:energy-coupling factor transport system permease protein
MVSFKLFPTLKRRVNSLKEVYSLRGVNYDKKDIKEQVKSYSPVLAILLETSMEGAFDIGEAAYVRGFLSGKRTVYQRQTFGKHDFILLCHMLFHTAVFTFIKVNNFDSFDIYSNFDIGTLLNYSVILMFLVAITYILTFHLNWRSKEI